MSTPPIVDEPVTESALVVAPPLSERLSPEMSPVLEIEKRVEVAKAAVEDAMVKRVVGEMPVVEEATKSERSAVGDVVPIPTLPLAKKVVDAVPPNCARVAERLVVDAPPLNCWRAVQVLAEERSELPVTRQVPPTA